MPDWLKKLLDFLGRVVLGDGGTLPPTPTTTTKPPVTTTTLPPTTTTMPPGPPPIPTTTTKPPVTTSTTRPPITTPPPTTTTKPPVDATIQALLGAHNRYRASKGKPPLTIDSRLTSAAKKHADWMARTGNFSHTGENGSSPFDRMRAAGYNYRAAGENIAYGYATVEAVMQGWINSPGHESNIRGDYAHVGFGVSAGSDGRLYWVADFGTPSSGLLMEKAEEFLSGTLIAPGVEPPAEHDEVEEDGLTPHTSENPGNLTPGTEIPTFREPRSALKEKLVFKRGACNPRNG